jgi:hypothetical protein
VPAPVMIRTLVVLALAVLVTSFARAADLPRHLPPEPVAKPPAPAPYVPPPPVVVLPPPVPQVALPPAYDQPTVRWRNGFYGHGWKRYNGWWFPPADFTFHNEPPRYAPAAPYTGSAPAYYR